MISKFDAALYALQNAHRSGVSFEEALVWDARFKQAYREHVEEVIASCAAFAPLGLNLEGRLGTLMRLASEGNGVSMEDVERVLGVPALVFKAFLFRLRISDTDALVYAGGNQLLSFAFTEIQPQGVH